MEARAITKYVRMSPRKARLVADLVRGKSALDALDILEFTNKKAAKVIKKTLSSAVHNATNNFKMDEDKLVVAEVMINDGPVLKRMMPRAMGRADVLRKPTAHVIVVVAEKEISDKEAEKPVEAKVVEKAEKSVKAEKVEKAEKTEKPVKAKAEKAVKAKADTKKTTKAKKTEKADK